MSISALAFMMIICGTVWGGFLLLLRRMAKSERRRASETQSGQTG